MKGLKSTAHTRYDLRYHFVFLPKYRKRVLKGELKKTIEGMIKFCCQIQGWELYEIAVHQDHVHLYIGAGPKWSPSKLMNLIKGGSSRKIRDLFPKLDEVYWGSTFWSDGFMVKSVGEMTDKVVSEYVSKH